MSSGEWSVWAIVLTAVSTFLLVVVTGLLVWVAWKQGKTTEAQLRAYVAVEGGLMRYVTLIEGGNGFKINIELRNYGQTPGYGLTSWIKQPVILPQDAVPFDAPTRQPDR